MPADKDVLRRRGRQAKVTGEAWEREVLHDVFDATGVRLVRQLSEKRDAKRGDHEHDERFPCSIQCKKRKEVNVWITLEEAREHIRLERGHMILRYPVGAIQLRRNRPGQANPRAFAMYQDDWLDLLETFRASPEGIPPWVIERRTGAKNPRVWDALDHARRTAVKMYGDQRCTPVGLGISGARENVVLVDYAGWLWTVGELYRRELW